MRFPVLFRTENLRAAAAVVAVPELPWPARGRYVLNQLVGTRLSRASMGRLLRRLYSGRSGVPSWDLAVVPQPIMDDSTLASLYFGTYESAEIVLLKKHFRGDAAVVELGSSLGVVAAHIAACMAPGSKLVCVEPNPELTACIAALVSSANSAVDLRLECVAISRAGETSVTMDLGDVNTGRVAAGTIGERAATVPALTLSQLLARHAFEEYTLICDIEGSEASILFDDPSAFEGCRELLIELHRATYRAKSIAPADLWARVHELGFSEIDLLRRSDDLWVGYFRRRTGAELRIGARNKKSRVSAREIVSCE